MDASPSIETVYEAIHALYNQNTNPAEKQQASTWLNEMQKSVSTYTLLYCELYKIHYFSFVIGIRMENSRRITC